MKLTLFFLAASALFTVAAIPMQSPQGSSSVPNPEHVPKVELRAWRMWAADKTAAQDMIITHYNGLEPGNEHKEARLAFAKKTWRNGKEASNEHMQYLDFDYHRGDTPDSDKIGQTVTLSRVRPPPETYFGSTVPKDHKLELTKATNKQYNALPPDQAKLVRSMKAKNGWSDGPGLREETQFTYHRGLLPRPHNTIGNPVTIYRPMSFLIDKGVPEKEAPVIKKRIRQEHENLEENHPLKQANYGVVTEGWRSNGKRGRVAGATLYKVKDKLIVSAEEDFEKIGDFHVPLGHGYRPEAKGPSASSTTQDDRSPQPLSINNNQEVDIQ